MLSVSVSVSACAPGREQTAANWTRCSAYIGALGWGWGGVVWNLLEWRGLVGFKVLSLGEFRDWWVSVGSSETGWFSYSGIGGFCSDFSPKISIIWGGAGYWNSSGLAAFQP